MNFINRKREELLFVYSPRLRDALILAGEQTLDVRVNKNNGRIYWLFEKNAVTEEIMRNINAPDRV